MNRYLWEITYLVGEERRQVKIKATQIADALDIFSANQQKDAIVVKIERL